MAGYCRVNILQVNTAERGGGAAAVATSLKRSYAGKGQQSWLAVGRKASRDPDVFEVPNDRARGQWPRFWNSAAAAVGNSGMPAGGRVAGILRDLGAPASAQARRAGSEVFDYPGTWLIPTLAPDTPDILQLHNLHGDYFDLRALPWLSERIPTVLTLHDAWLMSGHCAHSFDCGRWEVGCGICPDLSILPAIPRDDTAANWQRKRKIFSRSRIRVVTPSKWLMNRVERSMLAPAAIEKVVIPNGVDLAVFSPGDRNEVRKRLGLPLDRIILVFAANGIRENVWKDFASLREAITILGSSSTVRDVMFVAVGESSPPEQYGSATVQFVPYVEDETRMADYYRAADIYIHAARVDTFPNTVIEALACGTPVIATDVGGIPEQVVSLDLHNGGGAGRERATGILVEPANGPALAGAVEYLAGSPEVRKQLGANAALDARTRFNLEVQASEYLRLYEQMVSSSHGGSNQKTAMRAPTPQEVEQELRALREVESVGANRG